MGGVAESEDEVVGAIPLRLPHNLDGVGTGALPLQQAPPGIQQRPMG